MKPVDFERHASGDGRRFHLREFGDEWQVYGLGLRHIAMCRERELADMVADALEAQANWQDALAGLVDVQLAGQEQAADST